MVQFGEYPTEDEISQGGGGLLNGTWRFSSTTTAADPGSGRFRYNTGAYGTVVSIFIDDITRDGTDASNFLTLLSAGDRVYIQDVGDASDFAVWDVSASVDNVGWFTLTVAVAGSLSGNFLTNNRDCIIALQFGGSGGGGLPAFSATEETADRTATAAELAFVQMVAIAMPVAANGAKLFKFHHSIQATIPSGSLNLEIRYRLGPLGTIVDPIVATFQELNTLLGIGENVNNGSFVATPALNDLLTVTHQTSAGTVVMFARGGAGGAAGQGSYVEITEKT